MATDTRYARFNKTVAVWLTKNVGTMTCFWIFWLACFTILPSCLHEMGVVPAQWILPAFFLDSGSTSWRRGFSAPASSWF